MEHVHIMGVGGSAASGIAQIAAARGYKVTGCDHEAVTPYLEKAKKVGARYLSATTHRISTTQT